VESRLVGLPNDEILREGTEVVRKMKAEVRKVVFGPELKTTIDTLILAILGSGHVFVRANVGTAKTLACMAVARTIADAQFMKLDFQPDLMPKDLLGYQFYNRKTGEFETIRGPILSAHIFLANEINRATPKTQAALLAAMEERQVTVHTTTYPLPPVFVVLATANPQEYEGVYFLPEAQLDRFMLRPEIDFPSKKTGLRIISDPDFWRSTTFRVQERIEPVITLADIVALREAIFSGAIYCDSKIDGYVLDIVTAVYDHEDVEYISPRGVIDLKKVAILAAFEAGRTFVTPEDVQRFAVEALAHRTFLKPGALMRPGREHGPRHIVREALKNVRYD